MAESVACIITHYRAKESLARTVKSLSNVRGPKKIYVIENGSSDGSFEWLKENVKDAEIIQSTANTGYAGGMNIGIKHALNNGMDFLWLVGQDVTFEEDCLEILLAQWRKLKNPGFLGSLTDFNGEDKIYFFQATIDSTGDIRHRLENSRISDVPELKANEYGTSDYVNGACSFTHRSVIEKIGLIPEEYFLYFEDAEWGLKALRAGYKNYVSYRSRVHHHRHETGRNWTAEYYCRRNLFLFRKRNGFLKSWMKGAELTRLSWRMTKTKVKSIFSSNPELKESLKILKAVKLDLQNERWGRRSS